MTEQGVFLNSNRQIDLDCLLNPFVFGLALMKELLGWEHIRPCLLYVCFCKYLCDTERDGARTVTVYLSIGHRRAKVFKKKKGIGSVPYITRLLLAVLWVLFTAIYMTSCIMLMLPQTCNDSSSQMGKGSEEGVRSVCSPALITVFRWCSIRCLSQEKETVEASCCSVSSQEPCSIAASLDNIQKSV